MICTRIRNCRQRQQLQRRLERLDSWIRELEQRHARTVVQIANLEQSHTDHLLELEKRDVRFITVLTQAMRDFQGEIQAQQVERGISPDK